LDLAADQTRPSRRRWISYLLGTSFAAASLSFLYPVLRYLVPPEASEIAPNTGRIVPVGGKPVLLFRTPAGELRALTAKCTHLDCTVQYRVERSDIWCACHNGTYDTRGMNVSGPPPRPLTPLEVLTRGEKIVLKRA
jgi:Rieske Fe-S protein